MTIRDQLLIYKLEKIGLYRNMFIKHINEKHPPCMCNLNLITFKEIAHIAITEFRNDFPGRRP